MDTVSYTRMADMTEQDAWLLEQDTQELLSTYPARLLQAVGALAAFQGPLQVTRLEHSLQTATRAHRDGRPEEYVVACLIHDIGDELAPYSHGQMVAAILKPYVSDRICWMIEKHGLFQSYYYAHLIGLDRLGREKYRGHPYYQDCVDFCELYDQESFDPAYDSLDLEFFAGMVNRVFGKDLGFEGSMSA
jgi:predicted HD phosphohydrolase